VVALGDIYTYLSVSICILIYKPRQISTVEVWVEWRGRGKGKGTFLGVKRDSRGAQGISRE
jgi:hypothetical protein